MHMLSLFDLNGWHNVVHLLSGIVGLAMAGTAAKARLFSIGYGIVYVLVTILGFAVGDGGFLLSIIPINTDDNVLHSRRRRDAHRGRPGGPRRQPRRPLAA